MKYVWSIYMTIVITDFYCIYIASTICFNYYFLDSDVARIVNSKINFKNCKLHEDNLTKGCSLQNKIGEKLSL